MRIRLSGPSLIYRRENIPIPLLRLIGEPDVPDGEHGLENVNASSRSHRDLTAIPYLNSPSIQTSLHPAPHPQGLIFVSSRICKVRGFFLIFSPSLNSPPEGNADRMDSERLEIHRRPSFFSIKTGTTPGKRFELLRCRAPVAFKATAFPD